MPSVSESAYRAAQAAAAAFKADFKVTQYLDGDESHQVDVLECSDSPAPGFQTVSTVTLHATPNVLDGKDIRVELAMVGSSEAAMSNMVSTAAFCVMKDGWLAAPGVVFPDIVAMYEPASRFKHIMWTFPFPWDELASVPLAGGITAHWLVGVPVSDAERDFLMRSGYDEFEDRLASQSVEYFDLARPEVDLR